MTNPENFVKQRLVLMVGTEPGRFGGIASVIQGYIDSGITKRLGIDYVPTHRMGKPLSKICTYIKGILRIITIIHRYRIVHIHTASYWSFRRLFPVIVLANTMQKRIIVHLHGGLFDTYYVKATNAEKRLIRHGFAVADRVVVLSEDWFDRLADICRIEKMVVIPNGVQLDVIMGDMAVKKALRPRQLLFLGDILPRKGVYDIIDALALVLSKISTLKVYFCGRGEIDELRCYAADKELADLIYFRGWVDGGEKDALFKESHALILPSYAECLPMSILEAMVRGVPVIATNVGGIPNVITDGLDGYLIAPGDKIALADSIMRLLSNDDRWMQMARSAREKVKVRFSTDIVLVRLRALFKDLGIYEQG